MARRPISKSTPKKEEIIKNCPVCGSKLRQALLGIKGRPLKTVWACDKCDKYFRFRTLEEITELF